MYITGIYGVLNFKGKATITVGLYPLITHSISHYKLRELFQCTAIYGKEPNCRKIMHMYSHISSIVTDKERGVFIAKLSVSKCKGLLNPCSNPVVKSNDYYKLRSLGARKKSELNLEFSCDKARCCVLQQFPTYKVNHWQCL